MRDIVKAAVTKNMSRPAKSMKAKAMPPRKVLDTITPTDEIESAAIAAETVSSTQNGLKRKQPSVAAPSGRNEVEVMDMTGDDEDDDGWVPLTSSAKRRRVHAVSDVANLSTPRRNSVATPLASREKDVSSKPLAFAQSRPAVYGLLSPDSTPQKPQDKFKALHFANTAYASTSAVDNVAITGDGLVVEAATQAQSASASDGMAEAAARAGPAYEPAQVDVLDAVDHTNQVHPISNAQDDIATQPTTDRQPQASDRARIASPEPRQTPAPTVPQQEDEADASSGVGLPSRPPSEAPPSIPLENRALHDIPELADRYIPKVSTANDIDYTNPSKFCLKPPFWNRWQPRQYEKFACYLRETFDPTIFAREEGMPIEEVQHVFTAIVRRPLRDAGEARRRGEEGIAELMKEANKHGIAFRRYGKEERGEDGKLVKQRIYGELIGVEKGGIVLALRNGNKHIMPVSELVDEDVTFLFVNISAQDRLVVWETADRVPYIPTSKLRTWTLERDGRKCEARLAGIVGPGVVELTKEDDTRVRVKVEKFVDVDRVYLRGFLKARDKAVLWPKQ
ncbi:hypothetical protein LTR56_002930 [Elasticomyces elasticus]|nr:hypothetical protein LTR56_002930 [Elasticomyces elasticus]KAK4930716.1 hypothetical protein LTR49_002804 [Elasticomyces elasticus]KAK5759939.1 hypothetical protein LTS12_009987 [Elasticomyces elasticus]